MRDAFPRARAWLVSIGVLAAMAAVRADDWPQWLGPRRDGVFRERGIVERIPDAGLPVVWRIPVGAGYSAPAVARGRVYLTDRIAGDPANRPANPAIDRTAVPGVERVTCLEADTGRVRWRHEYDAPYNLAYPSGPRAAPLVSGGRVYTVGADGHLRCLRIRNGSLVWSRHYPTDFEAPTQTWGVASSPLLVDGLLVCLVGGKGHSVVALDARTGKEVWRALDTREPGYSSPVLVTAGGVRQLIVWDSVGVHSLNPRDGTVYWSEAFPTRMAHAIGTPRIVGDRLFVSSFFDGSLMLRLAADRPAAGVVWRIQGKNENHPESLHSLMSTPWIAGDHVYGVCGYGELRCLRADTGERVWETLVPTTTDGKRARWTTAFLIPHGDRCFLWTEHGDLALARLTPSGYEELGRQHLLEPTNLAGSRPVVWSHPAFADGSIFVRNDRELVRVDLRR